MKKFKNITKLFLYLVSINLFIPIRVESINYEVLISLSDVISQAKSKALESNDPLLIKYFEDTEQDSLEAIKKVKESNPNISEGELLRMFLFMIFIDNKMKNLNMMRTKLTYDVNRLEWASANEEYSKRINDFKTLLSDSKTLEMLKDPNFNSTFILNLFNLYLKLKTANENHFKELRSSTLAQRIASLPISLLFGFTVGVMTLIIKDMVTTGKKYSTLYNKESVSAGSITSVLLFYLLWTSISKDKEKYKFEHWRNLDLIKNLMETIIFIPGFKVNKEAVEKIKSLDLPEDLKALVSSINVLE